MATKSTTAAVSEQHEATVAEPTAQQVVNEGIMRVIEAHDIDVQKNRYKAMRAIAFQAFIESIEAEDFDSLVERASANVDALPSGWEIKAPAKATPQPTPAKAARTKKAPVKKASR